MKKMLFFKGLQIFAIAAGKASNNIEVKPKKYYNKICKLVTWIPIIYFILDLSDYDFVFTALMIMQEHPFVVTFYVFAVALLSPATALYENKKRGFPVKNHYIRNNLIFNVLGSFSACVMFKIVCSMIHDFRVLKDLQMESIISVFIPGCAAFVLLYQREEQQGEKKKKKKKKKKIVTDHDTSIQWINQQVNMLHLFNVYFVAIISSIMIVTYTIYCKIHNIPMMMGACHFVLLELVLFFFYALACQPHEYLYYIFLIDVPAILISSIYWMSWFVMSDKMLVYELIFIIINFILYVVIVLGKNGILVIGKKPKSEKVYRWHHKVLGIEVWLKSGFYIVSTAFVAVAYGFILLYPMKIQRVEGDVAEKYLIALCDDTEYNAEKVIGHMKQSDMYNVDMHDYNKEEYMQYINEKLESTFREKKIIPENRKTLKFEELSKWAESLSTG